MSATETAERFSAASRLKRAFRWTEAPDVPLPMRLAINATVWLEHVQALREQEEDLLLNERYNEASDEQRVILSQLIADGERLVFVAKKAGITRLPSGLALQDFESAIDSLRTTFRCQHGPKNSPAVNSQIKKLLDVSQRED